MILPQQLRQALQALTLNFPSSSWDEVLTASNAAIGGPSTAAAFAMGLVSSSGRINNDNNKNNESRRREEQHRSVCYSRVEQCILVVRLTSNISNIPMAAFLNHHQEMIQNL